MILEVSARVPLAESDYPIQSVQDYEYAPNVHVTYYSSDPKRYTAFTQYYRVEGKVKGRYCRIDANGTPFDCFAVLPNETNKTCSIEPYKQSRSIAMAPDHFTAEHCERILKQHQIDTLKEGIRVCRGIQNAFVSKAGSAREVGLPQGADKLTAFSTDRVLPEYTRGLAVERTIYEGKIACQRYFEKYGVKNRFDEAITNAGGLTGPKRGVGSGAAH